MITKVLRGVGSTRATWRDIQERERTKIINLSNAVAAKLKASSAVAKTVVSHIKCTFSRETWMSISAVPEANREWEKRNVRASDLVVTRQISPNLSLNLAGRFVRDSTEGDKRE